MKKSIFFLLITICSSFLPNTLLATDNEKEIAFTKRYLSIAPPAGWKLQPAGEWGMFQNCAHYAPNDEIISVAVCPSFQRNSTFADIIANAKQMEGSITLGESVILKKEDVVTLFVPLKKGTESAFFLIVKSTLTNEDILQKAQPLLKLFTEFDLPKELY